MISKEVRKRIDKLKMEIIELLSKSSGYYTTEIAERYDVPPKYVVLAIRELKEEKKI